MGASPLLILPACGEGDRAQRGGGAVRQAAQLRPSPSTTARRSAVPLPVPERI